MPKNKISRKELPNGCSVSQISVIPSNWKQVKKISRPWRVFYTFYDPANGKKQVSSKKMNRCSDVAERKNATELIIQRVGQALEMGYNPFYGKIVSSRQSKYDIEGKTLFIPALKRSLERVKVSPKYRKHIGDYVIPNVEKAAIHLNYHLLFIDEVKRKHIVFILDHLYEVNSGFTDNTFNRFRTDLKKLFRELVKIEAMEHNPIDENIPKKQTEQKQRETLTREQRVYINEYLAEKNPDYHRFLNIFFHSGARSTELCKLKGADVDLAGQRFKREILKGQKARKVWTPIKDIALRFWTEQMNGCKPDDFVFSNKLHPGPKELNPDYLSKLWYRWIKSKFVFTEGTKRTRGHYVDRVHIINGKPSIITADWYSLKHSNTTETMDILKNNYSTGAEKKVAEFNGHTSEAMVVKIYDVGREGREHQEIKKVNNPFA